MYITNDDLETLKQLKSFVWNYDLTDHEVEIYSDFVDLIDKLEAIKKIKNIKNTKRVAEKRKLNPSYARRKNRSTTDAKER